MRVNISKLKDLCINPLIGAGLSEEDAQIVFDHLLDEELLGKHSHGFIRMPSIKRIAASFASERRILVEDCTEFAVRLITENTIGLVAAYAATKKACELAMDGIGIVSAIGYSGTTGSLGYYGRMIAKQNLIGLIACSSEYAVAPWGGRDAILGTNPLAIAIPNGEKPIITDFSTAAMTYGDLMLAVKEKREVPYGIVLDSEGKPSHDPDDANNGCQLPMAGHKGYALGLALEILAGVFIGAKAGRDAVQASDGIIILAFKPDIFVSKNNFYSSLSSLIHEIKKSNLAYGSDGIRLPGENSVRIIKERRAEGVCDVPDVVYRELL